MSLAGESLWWLPSGAEVSGLAYVIPTLNCLHFTKQAVQSISARCGDRIYVIDNGSSDGTPDWLHNHTSVDLTAFKDNRGVAHAWNLGLRKAFSEGFDRALVMNNDIVLAADTVQALERGLKRHGGIVSAHTVAAMSAMYLIERRNTYGLPVDYACFMLEAATFERVGPFDEAFWPAYFEDQDFDCRAESIGIPRGYIGDAVAVHFVSQTLAGGHVPKHAEYFEKNRKLFLSRWRDYIREGRHARSF
jgi:GT2 family glycosyltransferase